MRTLPTFAVYLSVPLSIEVSQTLFTPQTALRFSIPQVVDQMADIEKATGLEDGTVDQPEPPLQEEIQETHFGDSSGPVFRMYSKIAEKDDNTMAERWQKDADGILIFAGLFSAAVATFLSLSIPDLRPSSQDISAFYLKNIYQNLADPSAPAPFTPSTVAAPPPFSPPPHIVAVNLLWVFSLCMSLTCAIMATMLQQWARQYVRFTHPRRRSPRRRARIRALFAGSVDKLFIRALSFLFPAICILRSSSSLWASSSSSSTSITPSSLTHSGFYALHADVLIHHVLTILPVRQPTLHANLCIPCFICGPFNLPRSQHVC
ncbi:hypothetical protein BJV77DRAFT_249519 [Russula vinacea]|nr:hypothetical protein BJV77DRAFT_249519 [Russula vinacea]